MKKYVTIVVILLACSFMFIACNNQQNETNKDGEKQIKEIHFGKKTDLGEKENIDSLFAFLDDIQLPNIKIDHPEDIYYQFKKENINEADPIYSLNMTYDEEVSGDISDDMHVKISNHEDAFNFRNVDNIEEKTLANGTEVSIWGSEKEMITVAIEGNDIYYFLQFLAGDFDAVNEDFMDIVKAMNNKTELHETMNKGLTQSFDDNFILPSYFATNMNLYDLSMSDIGLGFHYTKKFTTDLDEEVAPHLKYHITSDSLFWREMEDNDSHEEVTLPSGREAFMIQDSDRPTGFPHDSSKEIYLTERERQFRIEAYDIEQAHNNEEMDNLIKLLDSIDEK